MGFQDTFTRNDGGESNLEYDDTAFYYFFIAILGSILIPLFINIVNPWIVNPVKSKLKDACTCAACKEKSRKIYNEKKYHFFNAGYRLKFLIVVFLIVLIKKCYQNIDHEKQNIKSFDPYAILELQHGADKQEIKRAFRKLSAKYHPDKNKDPEATAKFILIGKAHECLTDEKKKEIYEKYGNPDGPGKLNVAIAMPSFLLKKENHVSILFVFFFILLIVLPGIGFYWYNSSGQKDEHGVLNSNKHGFYRGLNENLIVQKCPEFIALCDEYSNYPAKQEQTEDLIRLIRDIEPDFSIKKLPEAARKRYTIPYVLISAHLKGLVIPKSLEQYYNEIIQNAPQLLQSMISFVMSAPYFYRRLPPQQVGNIKFFGASTLTTLINFQQMLVQGLWVNEEQYPCLFQLSYFSENPTERRNKKLPKLQQLIAQPREERKLNFVMDEKDKQKVNDELDRLPNIDIQISAGVDGEEEITDQDIIEIKVKVVRQQLSEKEEAKLIHSVKFPSFRKEKWHVIIGSEKKEVFYYNLLAGEKREMECSWQTRFPIGKFSMIVNVKSDSYRGFDVEKQVDIVVKHHSMVTRKIEWHEDDQALDKDLSIFGQMMEQLNPQKDDSDEEEEEDEDEKKEKNKKSQQNNKNSNGDQEEDEEEEDDE